jgi:pre-rRNA-processing protein TSR2
MVMKPPPQDEVDEDDEDDEDEDVDEEEGGEAMDLEPPRDASINEGPIIDDDGFQLVQGKGKRRGR